MRIAQVLWVVAIATGCSVDQGPTSPQTETTSTSGSLVVNWTITGDADPDVCTLAATSAIDITILNSAAESVGRFQQSCNAFATTIELEAGLYAGEARLVGAGGVARTRAVPIDFFTMNAQSQFTQPIDFPVSVFLGTTE